MNDLSFFQHKIGSSFYQQIVLFILQNGRSVIH